ncbi:maleylpyruvate isomerase N-terminal domain-containing protein [Rugosimonospora africana]|uniref:Mycothiol-dependent maleylpyruvate isomerase metal-binding domain-containing protein n=1 Tax=Rugosimonospora africana TaxID=556532 RepID=A0A8J3QUZ5_9ACTN|nr:maleylpyruvate isomerase N-terminal domain-containing protein [Rugosimonospora africana]GIH16295.1 hypothetical protein Raf01_44670 [Rugosimonospora africana]
MDAIRLDVARLLDGLDRDLARLRAVVAGNPGAPVPTCPQWTLADLARHVADLYQNVVVRRLRMHAATPRQDLAAEEPVAALDRCYAAMTTEFADRDPDEHVGREPHETVRFWIRRMAHETAIHRVDAELAGGRAVTPIPQDLATDGLDELLIEFLETVTRLFPEEFADRLSDWAGRQVLVAAGDVAWRVTVRPDGAEVTSEVGFVAAAATVRAAPDVLLRWLYNRDGGDGVRIDGDGDLVVRLRRLLTAVTNTA